MARKPKDLGESQSLSADHPPPHTLTLTWPSGHSALLGAKQNGQQNTIDHATAGERHATTANAKHTARHPLRPTQKPATSKVRPTNSKQIRNPALPVAPWALRLPLGPPRLKRERCIPFFFQNHLLLHRRGCPQGLKRLPRRAKKTAERLRRLLESYKDGPKAKRPWRKPNLIRRSPAPTHTDADLAVWPQRVPRGQAERSTKHNQSRNGRRAPRNHRQRQAHCKAAT
jgi:hypothetical protein